MSSTRRAIVIGTGAGGLSAAAYLAQDGFEVLALEQGAHLGGYLAPFERDGFRFNPGLHYIGQCRPGQMVHDALAELGLDATELFCELDPDGFDVYRFPGQVVRLCRGLDAYRERLQGAFPEEDGLAHLFEIVADIQRVIDTAMAVVQRGPHLDDLAALRGLPTVLRWGRKTLGDLLGEALSQPRARAVLAAPCGDFGLPPSRASAVGAMMVLNHYGDGAFFPRGGSGALRDALVGAARRSGATFRTGARAARILVEGRRAVGVELAGGERLPADVVVSDADPVRTLSELVPQDALPGWLRRKVARTTPSLATFTAFLGLRRDLRRHGLGAFNVWDYPTWDVDAVYQPLFSGELPPKLGLFLSANSLKDDSGALAPAGCSTLEITTFVPYAQFSRWHGLPPSERGPEYAARKEALGARILQEVEERFPGLLGDVVVRDFATPLTNEDYTLAIAGGAYGPALTPEQWGPFRFATKTPIGGLLLAGAGVFGDGVAPCLLSGRAAARSAARAGLHR